MTENEIAKQILDAAFLVHTKLGPGLLESVYEVVLAHELRKKGLAVERQKAMPITYDGVRFDEAFRADLFVGCKVVAELKSVEALTALQREAGADTIEDERSQAWPSHKFWRSSSEERNQATY